MSLVEKVCKGRVNSAAAERQLRSWVIWCLNARSESKDDFYLGAHFKRGAIFDSDHMHLRLPTVQEEFLFCSNIMPTVQDYSKGGCNSFARTAILRCLILQLVNICILHSLVQRGHVRLVAFVGLVLLGEHGGGSAKH